MEWAFSAPSFAFFLVGAAKEQGRKGKLEA
jgi:hypothetical protein